MVPMNIAASKSASLVAGVAPSRSTHGADRLFLENTLLRISGAMFSHDSKRRVSGGDIIVASSAPEKIITIRPDPQIGQPGPLAYKLFFALIKKHSDMGPGAPSRVAFSKREIMQAIGRKTWGGRDSEQLSRALHEIHHTFVKASFKDEAGKWVEHSFNIFPEILIERRELASDPIEACVVTLAEPILASLADDHFTCLNHALMQKLSTIGQALYLRLFFSLTYLYDGHNRDRLRFSKRYDAICSEWFGGLTPRTYRSHILKAQLGPHFDQLVAEGFLSGYGLDKAKAGKGFVLTFHPGPMFFADYERFYRKQRSEQAALARSTSVSDNSDALKLAYLFAQKRGNLPANAVPFVSSKERETARQMLDQLPAADMAAFVDYALREAERTNFAVQSLGGIRQYLGAYLADRERLAEAILLEDSIAAARRDEDEKSAKETERFSAARRLFDTLPAQEQNTIQSEATKRAAAFRGSLKETMIEHFVGRITADRHPEV